MKTLQFVRNTLTAHQNKSEWCGEAPKTLKDELTISSDIYRKMSSQYLLISIERFQVSGKYLD